MFSDHNFSDNDSFFDSDDENKFDCMDDDVFVPNNLQRHSNPESFEPTTRNELTNGKPRSNNLVALIKSPPVLVGLNLENGYMLKKHVYKI